jgi:membrane protein implicated in regulation of membrane protease activity
MVFLRYWLLQIPGMVAAAAVLAALVRWGDLAPRLALLLFALWVLKDLAFYPVLRVAYQPASGREVRELVGAIGTARGELAPSGYVRVEGELWRAEATPEAGTIRDGGRVRIVAKRSMSLLVEPADEA